MFRLLRYTGEWVTTPSDNEGVGLSTKKADAYIFNDSERPIWEGNKDFEIVPLAEDEIMSRAGQPRLEGF